MFYAGCVVVKQYLNSMDEVRDFYSDLYENMPQDLGEDGPDGAMIMPNSLPQPTRKRRRSKGAEPSGSQERGASNEGQRAHLLLQMQLLAAAAASDDIANLASLDDFEDVSALGRSDDRGVLGFSHRYGVPGGIPQEEVDFRTSHP